MDVVLETAGSDKIEGVELVSEVMTLFGSDWLILVTPFGSDWVGLLLDLLLDEMLLFVLPLREPRK